MPPSIAPREFSESRTLLLAKEVLSIEADAILALRDRLTTGFSTAVSMLLQCRGRVVVSGMGKSGHVARKLAATLASTGTPAFFVHPAEASHGDLGMVTRDDVFIALSNSGETEELRAIIHPVKRKGAFLIAVTGNPHSTLATVADLHLDAKVEKEACPLNLAPTASTTAALALGDALAVAVLDARGFSRENFAESHPGGALGRRLLTRVSDVMRTGDAIPKVLVGSDLPQALLEMTRHRMGMTAVVDASNRAVGIFTDGDLRRLLEKTLNLQGIAIDEAMSTHPRSIHQSKMAEEALQIMEAHRINQLLVLDEAGLLIGALNIHDLFEAGIA